ncbi:sensor histidine kinase [Actinocorallia longicatena]|uniref:histidine kinase n=1 Tax=Actinocorallia longicatena TaxID=111803 RepID=A0ABP6Q7Y7_9ACTN
MSKSPRSRSLRTRLIPLLLIPLTTLTLLWGYLAVTTVDSALQNRIFDKDSRQLADLDKELDAELSAERIDTAQFLATPRAKGDVLRSQRLRTDDIVARYRATVDRVSRPQGNGAEYTTRAREMAAQLERLPEVRKQVDDRSADRVRIFDAYNAMYDALYLMYESTNVFSDQRLSRAVNATINGGRAMERITRESILLTAAFANGGQMSRNDRDAFVGTVREQRLLWDLERANMPDDLYETYLRKVLEGPDYQRLRTMEEQIVAAPGNRITVDPALWGSTVKAAKTTIGMAHYAVSDQYGDEGDAFGERILLRAGLLGGLGLIAVLLSIVLSVRFARTLLRELLRLRDEARELAVGRLPHLVARLRSGAEVDMAEEMPVWRPSRIREVGEVAEAFAATQRTAVAAAVGEADLRRGSSRIFLNIARRNQSLLQRQLVMLDQLESRAEADNLADLFKLDHLTTRMRRQAENLIILSGTVPARGWKQPVRMIDVLRAAIAEIEQYTRVSVVRTTDDGVSGAAATDVIHLLAELIENATSFSPPGTEVDVSASEAGNGCVVEIEDRGLGMTQQAYEQINEWLANPPDLDIVDTDQLGLFVAARLAARHGIKVMLRPSPFGGATAIVLIPSEILVARDGTAGLGDRNASREAGSGRLRGPAVNVQDAGEASVPPDARALKPGTSPAATGRHAGPREPGGRRIAQASRGSAAEGPLHAGLPVRTRGVNMTPSLRTVDPAEEAGEREPVTERSPERARLRMSAVQSGWRRGREADVTPADHENPTEMS